jgi:hypothetical protein
VTVKVAVVAPPCTAIAGCTIATKKLLVSDTVAPPRGAGEVNVIVPTVEEPLSTVAGAKLNNSRYGSAGTNVKVKLYEVPL